MLDAVPIGAAPSPAFIYTAIAAAIVTVIAAIGGMTVQIINAVSAARDRREAAAERRGLREQTAIVLKNGQDTGIKADTIIQKAVAIHSLADGNLSRMSTALDVANERIAGLEKLMAVIHDSNREKDAVQARLLEAAVAAPAAGHTISVAGGRRADDRTEATPSARDTPGSIGRDQ